MAYFDFYKKLHEPKFQAKLKSKITHLRNLEKSSQAGSVVDESRKGEVIADILRDCNYNAALLVPLYFPKYLGYDDNGNPVPLSLVNRPFTLDMYRLSMHGTTTIRGSRQLGKEQPYSAPVATPDGWSTMGALKVGDFVFGGDGKPTRVTSIFEQGVKDVYQVTFTDGSQAECGLDHLWKCRLAYHVNWRVLSLKEILHMYGENPEHNCAFRIPLCQPVEFPKKKHSIPPYTMGYLWASTTVEDGILKVMKPAADSLKRLQKEASGYSWTVGEDGLTTPANSKILRAFMKMGGGELIPEEYLTDDVEGRTAFLHGVMDTYGYAPPHRCSCYYAKSLKSAEQLKNLAESLGCSVSILPRQTIYDNIILPHRKGDTDHVVWFKRTGVDIFFSRSKKIHYKIRKHTATRIIKSIKKVRQENSRCITVDFKDHTYLTSNYVVTHNTVTLGSRQRIYAHLLSGFKSMYIAPHMEHVKTYANKLQDMMRHFRYQDDHPSFRKNLMYKEFTNGSILEIARVYTSADDVRGKSTQELILDENQHFDSSFYPEIQQLLRASKWKHILYAGTSLTVDTALEQQYLKSSQGVWIIRCGCGNWFNSGDVDQCLAAIRPKGLCCPECSRQLNPIRGCWHHPFQTMLNAGHVGMHVPQIIIPEFVNDPLEWSVLYQQFREYRGGPKFIQEVLGIPTEEASRELTESHLKRICVLPESPEVLRKNARAGQYKYVISGCDWGGSEFLPEYSQRESLTVHAIIGIRTTGQADILHFRDYAGMGYAGIIKQILKDHFDFGGQAMAVDAGVGESYISHLLDSDLQADRLIIFRYNSNMATIVKSSDEAHRNLRRFNLNRTESLTALFDAIKRPDDLGGPKVRCYNFDLAKRYLMQFLNLYRVPHEDVRSGLQRFLYRKHGARPDDALHAVNFAYILARILIGESLVPDPKDRDAFNQSFSYQDMAQQGVTWSVGPGAG